MRILIVGSNPSNASPDCSGFHITTKSRVVVERWLKDIECQIEYTNVATYKTKNNKPLTVKQIKENLPRLQEEIDGYDKIVALGNTASKALTLLLADFMAMPHPSGCCRFWNDKEAGEQKIEELKTYIGGLI